MDMRIKDRDEQMRRLDLLTWYKQYKSKSSSGIPNSSRANRVASSAVVCLRGSRTNLLFWSRPASPARQTRITDDKFESRPDGPVYGRPSEMPYEVGGIGPPGPFTDPPNASRAIRSGWDEDLCGRWAWCTFNRVGETEELGWNQKKQQL